MRDLYRSFEGVLICVQGEKVNEYRAWRVKNDLLGIGPPLGGSPIHDVALFSPAQAERVRKWLAENGVMDEDYEADLKAEAGA